VTIGSTKESLFDIQGNGNIGFSIYNIQREPNSNGYQYVPVSREVNGLALPATFRPTAFVLDLILKERSKMTRKDEQQYSSSRSS
jgi:hypothetical protein